MGEASDSPPLKVKQFFFLIKERLVVGAFAFYLLFFSLYDTLCFYLKHAFSRDDKIRFGETANRNGIAPREQRNGNYLFFFVICPRNILTREADMNLDTASLTLTFVSRRVNQAHAEENTRIQF